MGILLSAQRRDFHRAYATPIRAMWHYFSADHTLSDMACDTYFRTMMGELKPGDLIHAIDKTEDEAILRVQYLDDELSKIGVAVERRVTYEPTTESGYQIRHAGGRGRGTRYQIVDQNGDLVADNIMGQKAAMRALEELETRPEAA